MNRLSASNEAPPTVGGQDAPGYENACEPAGPHHMGPPGYPQVYWQSGEQIGSGYVPRDDNLDHVSGGAFAGDDWYTRRNQAQADPRNYRRDPYAHQEGSCLTGAAWAFVLALMVVIGAGVINLM